MKAFRPWILLLLAVLLPLRGAMAAVMLCPPAAASAEVAGVHDHAAHGGEAHDHGAHDHAALSQADSAPAEGAPANDSGSQVDKCGMCTASCSMTSLVSSVPRLQEPSFMALASFPALSAPAATFLSDGQDRPPRSI